MNELPEDTGEEEITPPVLPNDDVPTDVADELLTDEERLAMEDGDDAEDVYDPEKEEAEAAALAAAGSAAIPVEPAAAVTPAATPVPAADHTPLIPKDFKTPMAALDAKAAELENKWENGDISDTDYKAQLRAISRDQAALDIQQEDYQKLVVADQQNWKASVEAYKAANPGLWSDPAVQAAFDKEVGNVTSNPAFAKLPFGQQLARAHARLAADADVLGLAVPTAATAATPPPKPVAPPPPARARPAPPPTLAKLPASDMNTPGDGRFAAIDRAIAQSGDVVMTEAFVARMTPEERDAYGRGDDLY